jgi:DNA gyrase/topoisomerase IV subunit A
MVGSAKAMVYRTRLDEIRSLGRNTQGVKIMTKLADGDQVISMSAFRERSWEEIPELPKVASGRRNGSNGTNGHQSDQSEIAMDAMKTALQSQLSLALSTEDAEESDEETADGEDEAEGGDE